MRVTPVLAALSLLLPGALDAQAPGPGPAGREGPLRPVATYSIVARDPATGELGVAVQSHWFSVGPLVPWAEAGVGAVATQSLVEVSYGPLGLDLMRAGRTAPEALAGLLAADPHPEVRQVAMIDAAGRVVAGYTVLQPRIAVDPGSAQHSRFAGLFSGEKGLDPYTCAVSDVYQDLWDEGIYAGKGIYDVAAFARSLAGRVPESSLLCKTGLRYCRDGMWTRCEGIAAFQKNPE